MDRLIAILRHQARRVARRLFRRQVEINRSVCDRLGALERTGWACPAEVQALVERVAALELRQEAVEQRADSSLALGWDYVALARRLAQIEQRFDAMEAGDRDGDVRAA